jgi:hypothetical protein
MKAYLKTLRWLIGTAIILCIVYHAWMMSPMISPLFSAMVNSYFFMKIPYMIAMVVIFFLGGMFVRQAGWSIPVSSFAGPILLFFNVLLVDTIINCIIYWFCFINGGVKCNGLFNNPWIGVLHANGLVFLWMFPVALGFAALGAVVGSRENLQMRHESYRPESSALFWRACRWCFYSWVSIGLSFLCPHIRLLDSFSLPLGYGMSIVFFITGILFSFVAIFFAWPESSASFRRAGRWCLYAWLSICIWIAAASPCLFFYCPYDNRSLISIAIETLFFLAGTVFLFVALFLSLFGLFFSGETKRILFLIPTVIASIPLGFFLWLPNLGRL